MINFVNPMFLLAGAGLTALPIVLHLMMRQKPRRFEFPALRFVQQRHDTNRRRLRLRHLLLLALRIAAILLLALALARPITKLPGALGSREAPVAAVLVFDTSMRMEYRHQNRTRLEVAKRELGLWLLKQFPEGSQIAVLDTRPGPAAFQVDRGAAKHRIERLEAVANSQSLTAVLDEALGLLGQSELAQREVYVLTDLARVAWPAESAARLKDRVANSPGVAIYLIDVGIPEPTNSALGELRLSSQVLCDRSPLRIETDLSHSGPGGKRAVELYLLEADAETPDSADPAPRKRLEPDTETPVPADLTPRKRNERLVSLEPGPAEPIDFQVGGLQVGTHQGYVQIAGEDGLACDDRRYFTVEVRPAWRILVAAPKPPKRYAVFLTEALAPEGFRRSGRARFHCDVIALDDLPDHNLDAYSAVCLLDPGPLEPPCWQELGNYAADGHGVAIFLGRQAARIDAFNRPEPQELLPAKLVRQARRPEGDLYLAPRDFQHPVLASLAEDAGSIPWDAFPVFRYWQLGKPAAGVHVIVPFSDGRPAILERPLGKGRVLSMTTPVSDQPNLPGREPWNLLPVGQAWPFVILSNEMASYLVGSRDQTLNYFAGQPAVLQLDPQREYRSYTLSLLDSPGEVHERLTPDLRRQVLEVTSTDAAGNYRVEAGGSTSGVDRGFSVNLAAEQTRLERLSQDELAAVFRPIADRVTLFGPIPYRTAKDRDRIVRDVSKGRVGRELFALVILLAAVALGLEHVLANRFYRN